MPDPVTTINLTSIAQTTIMAAASIVVAVFGAWYAKHTSDKTAVDNLNVALQNGLGAMQQAVQSGLTTHPLQVQLPRITAPMAAGVQYVLDQAPAEISRLGYSPATIAAKLDARLGVKNIDTNIATAASPGPTPQPLAPVPDPSKPAIETKVV